MDYKHMAGKMKDLNEFLSHVNWHAILASLGLRRHRWNHVPWLAAGLAVGAGLGAGVAWWINSRRCPCCGALGCDGSCCTDDGMHCCMPEGEHHHHGEGGSENTGEASKES